MAFGKPLSERARASPARFPRSLRYVARVFSRVGCHVDVIRFLIYTFFFFCIFSPLTNPADKHKKYTPRALQCDSSNHDPIEVISGGGSIAQIRRLKLPFFSKLNITLHQKEVVSLWVRDLQHIARLPVEK